MNPNLINVIFYILNNFKDKEFSYHSDDTSSPMFGRQGNEFFITNGKLAGPFEIKVINSNTVECTIKVSWHSKRCKYEFIQTATENRTDYGIYIFTATLDDSTQIVSVKEVDWIPFDKDPTFQRRLDINYRAAVYAKKGLEERLIQPLSGYIKSLSSEFNRLIDKESIVSYVRDNYNINVVLKGDFMAGDRNINTGGGNYNERIKGNYIQGNYNAGNFSVGGSVGGNVNNVQGDNNRAVQGDNNQAVLGDGNQVTQQNQAGADTAESLTKEDVVKLLAQLETLIQGAELPADTKEEVVEDLSAAKKATEKKEPNKQRALDRLGTVAETLEKTSKGVDAGEKIWTTAKPIIVKVASWLGAAAGSHLLGL